jgi:beta-1,4-mannosyl-glycoprotein beta-1,4-N-acetylglucosaminyltransferase
MAVMQRLRLPRLNRHLSKLALIGLSSVAIFSTLALLFSTEVFTAWRDIGYLTRPIWDSPPPPFRVVNHFAQADGLSADRWCRLHGWRERGDDSASLSPADQHRARPRVYDAVIFSVELDLLEIRLRELWDVVDVFVVVESDRTFTGLAKNTTFADHRERFAWASAKLHYLFHPGRLLRPGESPFVQEGELRISVNDALQAAGARADDLIIMADIDELPRRDTIRLLATCEGWADVIHLQMHNFLYSFEYHVDDESWRPTVRRYNPGSTWYSHGRVADTLLADAGWHCSFCFRYLHEFRFKMQAYSHADRVTDPALLEDARIQQVVCSGDDIYDMFPEAYTFLELARRLGQIAKSTSMRDLPGYLIANAERFKYLLPGGCRREE